MKHSLIRKLIVAGLAASAISIATAQDLTAAQVKSRLEAAGYTNVQNVKKEGTQARDVYAIAAGRALNPPPRERKHPLGATTTRGRKLRNY